MFHFGSAVHAERLMAARVREPLLEQAFLLHQPPGLPIALVPAAYSAIATESRTPVLSSSG